MDLKKIRAFLLPGMIFWFGLQTVRVFFPSVMWFLNQQMGEFELAGYALITFGLIFLAPFMGRMLKERTALALVMGLILLVRVALQFNSNALAGLILSTLGVALFVMFLPLWLQSIRNRSDASGISISAVVIPLVFLIDTASRSLLWSYDLVWRKSWWSYFIVMGLSVFTAWLLWKDYLGSTDVDKYLEPSLSRVIPLLGFGAWMYLGFGLILNPLALLGLTPMDDRIAHLVVAAVSAAGAVLAVWSATWEVTSSRTGKLLPVAAAVLAGLLLYFRAAPTALWFVILALALWMALGRILRSVSTGNHLQPGSWRTSLVLFFSFLLMLTFIFLNEFDFHWITPAAATMLAVMSLLAKYPPVYSLQTSLLRQDINRWGGYIAQAAMAAVVIWVVWNQPLSPLPRVPASNVLRVMTYNIHQGLNADIYMDLEEISRVIEAQDADIIGLNEVNRGRANNGYTDTLAFISRRLNMPYVYGANFVDGQYGNAVLSRYPIDTWKNRHYTTNTTEVRGLLHTVINLGAGREVNFFSTHLDHTGSPQNARAAQVLEAVDIIGSEQTIFSGDLNAAPEATELQPLYQGAWLDALARSGLDDAFTFWSDRRQRIDYVFFTPDLQLVRAVVVESRASDHLPVVVDFQLP